MKKIISSILLISVIAICLLSAASSPNIEQKQSPLFKTSLQWSIDKIEHKFQNLALQNTSATKDVRCIKTMTPDTFVTTKYCGPYASK
jgi:hypothetical protein